MNDGGGWQSEWRVRFASELSRAVSAHPSVEMVVLGGSPSRGLSDRFSDLDIVVYWKEAVDSGWLDVPRYAELGGRVWLTSDPVSGDSLESYRFGGLKADFGHTTTKAWENMAARVVDRLDFDDDDLGSIAGFLDAVPLHGAEQFGGMKERFDPYPPALAEKVVKSSLRFFVKGYLENQALARGDLLAFQDGRAMMLRRILAVLAALNGLWYSSAEPRWLRYWLGRMTLKPSGIEASVAEALAGDTPGAVRALERLIEDTLSLVSDRMPRIDVGMIRRRRELLASLPCGEPPAGLPPES